MNKMMLRQALLKQRREMDPKTWRDRSQQITERLLAQSCFKAGQTVLAYFSIRQEADLTGLWTQAGLDLQFGFPRCESESRLVWHRWQLGEALLSGAFGILEPLLTAPELHAQAVDWILVPCVGCDRRGFRIGYGGGFYDRLLETPTWRGIPTIGITFELGLVAKLDPDPWDQPLDYICTEKEWIGCTQ